MRKISTPKAAIVTGIFLFAVIAAYLLIWAGAATPTASIEPELATTSGNAQVINDTGASGGKAIIFPTPPSSGSFTIAAAGDIANEKGEQQTSDLILADSSIQTVLVLGDAAYPDGSASDFANKYDPTWGRFKAKTKPTPGNHEYNTSGASAYYAYFNNVPEYYSFDINNWHFISLNSQIPRTATSPQVNWLKADLAANAANPAKKCVLAYWHYPRFTAAKHSDDTSVQPFFQALYDANADIILAGHSHSYERYAKSTPTGVVDNTRGIRNFVVGTGGTTLGGSAGVTVGTRDFLLNSYGVLKLTMTDTTFNWKFVDVSGAVRDQGTETCH